MTVASTAPSRPVPGSLLAYGIILLTGAALWSVSTYTPSRMPAIGPYEFSWPIWLVVTLTGFWFQRGLSFVEAHERPGVWRQAAFWAGLLLIYVVTQTYFEYVAQRMFFINRAQHVAMHHLGPVLLALSASGPAILAGAPRWVRHAFDSAPARATMAVLQQPLVAAFLFVGLFWFWLIPPVHFAAMLDPVLYQLMNWSMVLDGVLFWALVLDTRPRPPAWTGFGVRIALAFGVMFPQIVLGALVSFANRDLFPYYAFCGRYFSGIGALTDQKIGGIIIWIPPAMMSVIAVLIVLNNMRRAGADI